jgi:FKBP-type peptidyl-prolyl cis-trans isomerase
MPRPRASWGRWASTPENGDAVFILYTGWLTDGTEFDSSFKVDPPRTFPVIMGGAGAIAGFMEGTSGMREGEKRHLVIPPELGYGAAGAGAVIPSFHPNSGTALPEQGR